MENNKRQTSESQGKQPEIETETETESKTQSVINPGNTDQTSSASSATTGKKPSSVYALIWIGIIAAILGVLFHESFDSEKVLFANDGPLGVLMNPAGQLPENFTGIWQDTNWLGGAEISAPPNISNLIRWSLGPIGYAKFYAPLSLLFLGWTAWVFFRAQRFSIAVAGLGALAATLNMNTFSNACWGLPSRALALGAVFLALAALTSPGIRQNWARFVLAGFGVGLSVMEGYDNGAIFSIFVGIFAIYWIVIQSRSSVPSAGEMTKGNADSAQGISETQLSAHNSASASFSLKNTLLRALGAASLIAVVAALVSSHAVLSVISTQLESQGSPTQASGSGSGAGSESSESDAEAAKRNWDWATQWSLPKMEALRIWIPGVFGYRMDSADGGNYWGTVGRQPGWEDHRQGLPRHSGSGEYLGLGVALMAFWGLINSLRGSKSGWSLSSRGMVWFWAAVAVITLALSFGRHAPFYKIIYSLPYFSTVRNPIKFMHVFHLAALILFGYGLQSFVREFLELKPSASTNLSKASSPKDDRSDKDKKGSAVRRFKLWWAHDASPIKKTWITILTGWIGLSVIGWVIFASFKTEIAGYLRSNGFDQTQATQIHAFSVGEVGWFVVWSIIFSALALAAVWGWFRGPRSKIALAMLGVFIVSDLVRADYHWIVAYKYEDRFNTNVVVDTLKESPQLHRVVAPALLTNPRQASPYFQAICREWVQHHFQYFGIHALEIIQMPRTPKDYNQLNQAFYNGLAGSPNDQGMVLLPRLWELTNTRYILGLRALANNLNGELDPIQRRFEVKLTFRIDPANTPSGYEIKEDPKGQFAIFEFTGALPRISLYNQWSWQSSDEDTLKRLTDLSWNPLSKVFLNPSPDQPDQLPAPTSGSASVSAKVAGEAVDPKPDVQAMTAESIEYLSYAPKRFKVKATPKKPSILLVNDKFNPNWKVWVDGEEKPLLRLNFMMRGVYLEQPGEHEIEFVYSPSNKGLWTTVTSSLACLCVLVWVSRNKSGPEKSQQKSPLSPQV